MTITTKDIYIDETYTLHDLLFAADNVIEAVRTLEDKLEPYQDEMNTLIDRYQAMRNLLINDHFSTQYEMEFYNASKESH